MLREQRKTWILRLVVYALWTVLAYFIGQKFLGGF